MATETDGLLTHRQQVMVKARLGMGVISAIKRAIKQASVLGLTAALYKPSVKFTASYKDIQYLHAYRQYLQ